MKLTQRREKALIEALRNMPEHTLFHLIADSKKVAMTVLRDQELSRRMERYEYTPAHMAVFHHKKAAIEALKNQEIGLIKDKILRTTVIEDAVSTHREAAIYVIKHKPDLLNMRNGWSRTLADTIQRKWGDEIFAKALSLQNLKGRIAKTGNAIIAKLKYSS